MQNHLTGRRAAPGKPKQLRSDEVTPAWASHIRAQRKRLGLTQRELADLAGVAERTMIAIERGADSVGLGTLRRVLAVLGLGLNVVPGHGEIAPGA
jgi:y4mF family transcriptional regulator